MTDTSRDKAPRKAILHLHGVDEVSLVGRPANGEPFLIVKSAQEPGRRVVQADDGTLRTDTDDRRLELPDAVALGLSKFADVMKALAQKAITIDSSAADRAIDVIYEMFSRLDALMGLIYSLPTEPGGGTMDSQIAEELGEIAGMLLELAQMFAGAEVTMSRRVQDAVSVDEGDVQCVVLTQRGGELTEESATALTGVLDVMKAGAKMSSANLKRLRGIAEDLTAFVSSMEPDVAKSASDEMDVMERIVSAYERLGGKVLALEAQVTRLAARLAPDSAAIGGTQD